MEDYNKDSGKGDPKRRKLTGSSRWTLSSISRQIAERQANDNVDDMLLQQNTPNSSGGYPHEEESQVLNSVTSVSENNDFASMNNFEKAFNEAHEATEYHTNTVLIDQNQCMESSVIDDDYPEEMVSDPEGVDECS
ncbi:Uncharacterized protein APZ42_034032 [Daphnia magna]|uniref:Uncharacterized protein n=1 Tax=Daphnia magna TaxID=35525 RepID=A0A164KIC1_9CRUS|nr:Uncharacterized protein APZ42_034032 [Daphnia magna]